VALLSGGRQREWTDQAGASSRVRTTSSGLTGEVIFHGLAALTSGTEGGMASIFRNLQHGEEIRVTACKAPALRKESNDDKADD
jgi:hypothetical protein